MKKTIILVFVLILGLDTIAGDGKSFLMLRSGLSVPVGKYASNMIDGGSFTTLGMSYGAEGAWFFKDFIGVGADINYSLHTVDVRTLGRAMMDNDQFLTDVYIRSEPYQMLTLSVGLYSKINIINRISILPKLMGG